MTFHTCPKQTKKREEEMEGGKQGRSGLWNAPHTVTHDKFQVLTHIHQHVHDVTACIYITVCMHIHSDSIRRNQGQSSLVNFGSIKRSSLLAVQPAVQISMVNMNKLHVAAGRLAASEKNNHLSPLPQRRRKVSFDVKDNDPAESSRKPSISQVPPKKNPSILKKDSHPSILKKDSHRSQEYVIIDRDNGIIGSALSKDEDDHDKMSKVSDLECRITSKALAETDKNLTRALKKRKSEDRREGSCKVHDHSKAERAQALAELVERRKNAANRRTGSSSNKTELPATSRDSLGDELELGSDKDSKLPEPPTLSEIMAITVPRSKLVKWFTEPYFNELITGCFVRVFAGKGEAEAPVYTLCEVLNVDAADCNPQYKFESRSTYKYLNVVRGNGTPARLAMTMVSNSPPRKVEFDQWVTDVKLNRGHMPTKQELLEKKQAFQKVNSFVYSAAVVKQMVEEKRSSGRKPANIATEKARLRRELELASHSDQIELKRIQDRLRELEAVRESSVGSRKKALAVEELNRKNLLANLNTSTKHVSSKSEEDYDPFSRLWTRPRGFNKASSSAGTSNHASEAADNSTMATAPPTVDAVGEVDATAKMDFEASGLMAVLDKFIGARGAKAGYLARKQQVEAAVGVRVPEDDGKTHARAMTIAEYKKRRGLI